jgi:hypothetical protein
VPLWVFILFCTGWALYPGHYINDASELLAFTLRIVGITYQNPEPDFSIITDREHLIVSSDDARGILFRYLPHSNPKFGNTNRLKRDRRMSEVRVCVYIHFAENPLGHNDVICGPRDPTQGLHDVHGLNRCILVLMTATVTTTAIRRAVGIDEHIL